MFGLIFRKKEKGRVFIQTPISRKQKIEVKILPPEWKRFIEI